jgi:hypothetical protein
MNGHTNTKAHTNTKEDTTANDEMRGAGACR